MTAAEALARDLATIEVDLDHGYKQRPADRYLLATRIAYVVTAELGVDEYAALEVADAAVAAATGHPLAA